MRKLLFVFIFALFFTLCGCSENVGESVSETDARLTATPEELVGLYFEYLYKEDYESISELYPEGFDSKEPYPYAEDLGLGFVPLAELYEQFKGYRLESLDIFDYSFDLEMHSGNAQEIHADYNEWYGYYSDGFGKINCGVHLENYKKGDGGIYQFNFLFMRIDGVWYLIN